MAKSRTTPPTAVQKRLAAERAADARERIQLAQRRRRLTVIAAALGSVVVVVAAFVVVKLVDGGNGLKSGRKSSAAPASITQTLADIPASAFDSVGVGGATAYPQAIEQKALGSSTRPELLYVGAEFCPICAAERWPLTVALARFGTFTNLGTTYSSPSDTNPNTPTLTFHGASYTSRYLSFVGKEIETNQVVDGHYTALDKLTAAQDTLFTAAGSSFPFLDLDGAFELRTWQYDGKILAGMTPAQVARAVARPTTPIAKDVLGSANVLTARICQLTKDEPASVCTSSGVQAAAKAVSAATSGS